MNRMNEPGEAIQLAKGDEKADKRREEKRRGKRRERCEKGESNPHAEGARS